MADGFLIDKATAERFERAASIVLGNRGAETVQARQEVFERRGLRFYKVPAGGANLTGNPAFPLPYTCTKMKWNSAGTGLEETTVTETVYFFQAVDAGTIVEVGTFAGKNIAFAKPSPKPQHAQIDWSSEAISTSTTETTTELGVRLLASTNEQTFFQFAPFDKGIRIYQPGLYSIVCPIQYIENFTEIRQKLTFDVTDTLSTTQGFRVYEGNMVDNKLVVCDRQETDPWNNSYEIARHRWEDQLRLVHASNIPSPWVMMTTHAAMFYVPQSLLDLYPILMIKNLFRYSISSGSGTFRTFTGSTVATDQSTIVTYWGDYSEIASLGSTWSAWQVDLPSTGQGPATPT